MKKLSLVLAGLLAASAMAWANDVSWMVNWGVYTHDASDLVTTESGAVLDQYDVLWQLIYAGPNNTIDPVDVSASGFVSGDDEVLGTRELSKGDAIFDNYLYLQEGVSYENTVTPLTYSYSEDDPYYVYQRIYESQKPEAGTYYYESPLVKLDTDYGAGIQTIGLGPAESGIQSTLQVQGPASVPEPATMSLLGLGALAMVLRRKLRK
ncbi:MAG: PEP-CTERM sorting domain-containing protein [Kiritimatiellae bacterium]|nr:PEP-CTERM sorting domain-containing protein [Kiritimatiellia bacterium]